VGIRARHGEGRDLHSASVASRWHALSHRRRNEAVVPVPCGYDSRKSRGEPSE